MWCLLLLTSSNLYETSSYLLQECVSDCIYPPFTTTSYTLTLPSTALVQFLRALWNAVSQAIVLILPQIKLDSQLSHCACFSVDSCKRKKLVFYVSHCVLGSFGHSCLIFTLNNTRPTWRNPKLGSTQLSTFPMFRVWALPGMSSLPWLSPLLTNTGFSPSKWALTLHSGLFSIISWLTFPLVAFSILSILSCRHLLVHRENRKDQELTLPTSCSHPNVGSSCPKGVASLLFSEPHASTYPGPHALHLNGGLNPSVFLCLPGTIKCSLSVCSF